MPHASGVARSRGPADGARLSRAGRVRDLHRRVAGGRRDRRLHRPGMTILPFDLNDRLREPEVPDDDVFDPDSIARRYGETPPVDAPAAPPVARRSYRLAAL